MSKPWWIDISDLRGRLAQSHEIDNSAGDTIGAWWKCRGPAESCPGEKADQGVTENYPRSNMNHPPILQDTAWGKTFEDLWLYPNTFASDDGGCLDSDVEM